MFSNLRRRTKTLHVHPGKFSRQSKKNLAPPLTPRLALPPAAPHRRIASHGSSGGDLQRERGTQRAHAREPRSHSSRARCRRAASLTRCPSPPSSVLRSNFTGTDEPASTAAGSPDEIAKLFSSLYGQPSAAVLPSAESVAMKPLKIGVVLPGGQAPGGQLICGIFDYLQERAKGSTMYGFMGGPAGVMKGNYVELTADFVYPYRNQSSEIQNSCCIMGVVAEMVNALDRLN